MSALSPAHPVTFRLAALQASWILTRLAAFCRLRHTPLTVPHCRVLSTRSRNFPQRTILRHTGALWGLDFRPELSRFPLKTERPDRSSQVAVWGCFSPPVDMYCSGSTACPGRSSAPMPRTWSRSCCSQLASVSYELLHLQPYSSAQLPVLPLGCTENDSGLASLMLPMCCGRLWSFHLRH